MKLEIMSDENTETDLALQYMFSIGGAFESESETEPDPVIPPEEFCFPCYPRSHEWFIKIQNCGVSRYNKVNQTFEPLSEENKIHGEIKYLSSYHAKRFPSSICQIFDNLILPTDTYVASHMEGDHYIIDDVIPISF